MAYGICRVENLTASSIGGAETHNARKYKELGKTEPDNINKTTCAHLGSNTHYVRGIEDDYKGLKIKEAIDNRLSELGIKPRNNSVVALEYVLALTGTDKEKFMMWEATSSNGNASSYSPSGFLSKAHQWIAEKHGGMDNVIAISNHFDETNPHVHVIVVPIVEKTVKWKNQRGEGERKENRLCARDFTGHPDKLRQLQTDYFNFIEKEQFGRKMNVEFYRGTKKEKQLREYTRATDHILGELKAKLDKTIDLAEAKAIKLELEAKKAEFEKKQGEDGRIIENHKIIQGQKDKKDESQKKWQKGFNTRHM